MEASSQYEIERNDLRSLVERIKRGTCVLVLGPRIATRANDLEHRPLDELLANYLLTRIGKQESEACPSRANLRRSAEDYLRQGHDHVDLEIAAEDFYRHVAGETTDFHRNLAQLPFTLCVSASPDSLMVKAFEEAGKSPQKGHYCFRKTTSARLSSPTEDKPLVYYLFGHYEDPNSLVLTEGDLIEFLVKIVKGDPPVPDQVRSILADPTASFLFLGFGFHNWYLRVLLHVLNTYGHKSKSIAFEDTQFFDHPEHGQVVGFTDNLKIDFRPLRWEAFAQQLRDTYLAGTPRKVAEVPIAQSLSAIAPRVFLSYASEDREAVEALAAELEAQGIRVWQDKQDLRAGDNWRRVLLDVISNKVDYVIVLQTPAMTTRIKGVFLWEIEAALKQQEEMGEFEGQRFRFLLPVKIGACAPFSSLNASHVIDVGEPRGVESLVRSIQEDWGRREALRSLGRVT